MPNIDARPLAFPAPDAAQAATTMGDWNALPEVVKIEICKRLNVGDQARLGNVSRAWRNIVVSQRFDQAATAFIAEREGVRPEDCPKPPYRSDARGLVGELKARGFAYAAMLVNLHATCESLSSVATDRAVYDIIPNVTLAGSTVFLPQVGEPEFMGQTHQNPLVLVSTDGTQRVPQALRSVDPINEGQFVVTSSLLSPGALDVARVVKRDGGLQLLDISCDALQPFPHVFTLPGSNILDAVVSRDSKYVAASYTSPNDHHFHLRVHDCIANTTVSDTIVPPPRPSHLSVDSHGTVVIGGAHIREVQAGGDGRAAALTPLPDGFYAIRLSPDERYVVCRHYDTGEIRLEGRQGGRCITLDPGGEPGRNRKACSIAFSPAMAMAAVTYINGTLRIYDLLTADEQANVLPPKLQVQLQGHRVPQPFKNPAATWFDRDGGGVHAAYLLSQQSVQADPHTGLMHLRFQ